MGKKAPSRSVISKEKENLRTIENNTRKADDRAYGFEGKTVGEIREEYQAVKRARNVPVQDDATTTGYHRIEMDE